MVRLSSFVVAVVCAAATIASDSSHVARAAAHKKMIKVRDNIPTASSSGLPSVPTTPPEAAKDVEGIEKSNNLTEFNAKRDGNFRFTFYEAGLGACGQTNSDTDYIVALNSNQYGGGENCGKAITIEINGQQAQATIMDECPGCPYGGLDFTPGLFQFFNPLSLGTAYGNWWFN